MAEQTVPMPTKELQLRTASLEIRSIDGTITLRQYVLVDADDGFALIDRNRRHLSRYGDKTASKYPTLESFEESIRNPKNPNRLRLGIRNDKGVLVGSINLAPDTDNPRSGEIGYYLGSEFQGNGYMVKAVQTLTEYAFNSLNYDQIYAKVHVSNEASASVLEKIGYLYSGKVGLDAIYINKRHSTSPMPQQTSQGTTIVFITEKAVEISEAYATVPKGHRMALLDEVDLAFRESPSFRNRICTFPDEVFAEWMGRLVTLNGHELYEASARYDFVHAIAMSSDIAKVTYVKIDNTSQQVDKALRNEPEKK